MQVSRQPFRYLTASVRVMQWSFWDGVTILLATSLFALIGAHGCEGAGRPTSTCRSDEDADFLAASSLLSVKGRQNPPIHEGETKAKPLIRVVREGSLRLLQNTTVHNARKG